MTETLIFVDLGGGAWVSTDHIESIQTAPAGTAYVGLRSGKGLPSTMTPKELMEKLAEVYEQVRR